MRTRRSLVFSTALLGTALTLAACVQQAPVALGPNPNPPVPPPPPEQRPLPPVSEQQLVWRPGDWDWAGTGYVWRPGDWETLGGHSTQFLPGHWAVEGNAWVWVRGRWL